MTSTQPHMTSTQPHQTPYRQLRRPTTDRMVAGVASGLGRYFTVDPTLVRVVFAVATLLTGGVAALAYPIMWFLMPEEPAGAPAWPVGAAGPATPNPVPPGPTTHGPKPAGPATHGPVPPGPTTHGPVPAGPGYAPTPAAASAGPVEPPTQVIRTVPPTAG